MFRTPQVIHVPSFYAVADVTVFVWGRFLDITTNLTYHGYSCRLQVLHAWEAPVKHPYGKGVRRWYVTPIGS
jgi:hypothetical protein